MNTRNYLGRVIFLIAYIAGLFFVFQGLGHSILLNNLADVLLFSGLSALAINILLLSCFFETPKDVIASSLNVLILLSGLYLYEGFPHPVLNALFLYASVCLIVSIASVVFYNPDEKGDSWKQRLSELLKKAATAIGSSKVIFSILIAALLISEYSSKDIMFYAFTGMGLVLLANDPIRQLVLSAIVFIVSFFRKKDEELSDPIGHIAAVQAKDTFVIDLIDINKRPSLNTFDFIEFKYGTDNLFFRGFIIDRYYLDSQQKAKILKTSTTIINDHNKKEFTSYKSNTAYKVKSPSDDEKKILENFVGTIIEKSDISQIKFEYSSQKMLTNGDLLSIAGKGKAGEKVNVLYQITQAQTEIKSLENQNEIGLIEAMATQLGVWRERERNFENYGWVFPINTPILLATDIKGPDKRDGEIQLGTIEDTSFNVLANTNNLITHHTAILGTTGTGKSVFARNMVKSIKDAGVKVFCIDLTGDTRRFIEYQELVDTNELTTMTDLSLDQTGRNFVATQKQKKFSEHLTHYTDLQDCHYGKTPKDTRKLAENIEKHIKDKLEDFIKSDDKKIGLLELSELSNTAESLEYTKFFFKVLFDLAKENKFKEKKALIILEEAHTLIPEWNSVGGTDDKTARKLTNTIAQIALQGRKYNVGLLVIAQRTANVSKTILTQCNTIISFKQFDNTSRDFLINHFGEAFIKSLSILKNRRAIIAGKALISDVPIIFKVPEIEEVEIVPTEEESADE